MKENTRINAIDLEAAGLASDSYPIEIGLIMADGEYYSSLIKPLKDWQYWCINAEKIHGINRELLMDTGKDIVTVCDEVNQLCADQTLFSDGWSYDNRWLNKLFGSAKRRQLFQCSPIETILNDQHIYRWAKYKRQCSKGFDIAPHRALNDAMIIQHVLQSLLQENTLSAKVLPLKTYKADRVYPVLKAIS